MDALDFVEAQDDYAAIYTKKGSHLKNERLNSLEEMLDPVSFCRIHRSYIMNINYLSKIEPHTKDTKTAILKNGRNLPISRTGHTRLKKML